MADVPVLLGKLRRLLRSRGRAHHEIDDLTQEAFLRLQLYRRANVVNHEEAFLVTTALNLSAEQARRDNRATMRMANVNVLGLRDSAPEVDRVLAGQQRLHQLTLGLERLTPRSREVFLLHRTEGLSYPQIAKRLDISVSMVEKHVARAAHFLTDWMAKCED